MKLKLLTGIVFCLSLSQVYADEAARKSKVYTCSEHDGHLDDPKNDLKFTFTIGEPNDGDSYKNSKLEILNFPKSFPKIGEVTSLDHVTKNFGWFITGSLYSKGVFTLELADRSYDKVFDKSIYKGQLSYISNGLVFAKDGFAAPRIMVYRVNCTRD